MKTMKKALALLLVLVMTLAMGAAVSADSTTYTITITGSTAGHTFEAYRIFAGDLETKDSKTVLTNIVWGDGVNTSAEVNGQTLEAAFENKTAAKVAEELSGNSSAAAAADFAGKIAPYLSTTCTASGAFADNKYTISGLEAGYYLVKDRDSSLTGKDDAYTAYIMQVVGSVTVKVKAQKPTLQKQIQHNDDDSWGAVGDNQIGDVVEFRLISTVPEVTGYTAYTYTITDTMSAGLTSLVVSGSDITVKVNDAGDALPTDYYTVAVDTANPNKFTVTVDILKGITDRKMTSGDSLYIYYSGVLNPNAKIYDTGKEDNTAFLTYSNNPNDAAGTATTPEVKVYDWTYKVTVKKVDKQSNQLTGAKFVLSRSNTLTVAGMNCDENGVPTVTIGLIGLVKTAEGQYRIATADDDAANVVYDIDAGSSVISGLDDAADYYLYETKAPAGYNLLAAPASFRISAEYKADGSGFAANKPVITINNNGNPSLTLSVDVVNEAGSTLPSTGGVGTTVFYVVGGLLAAGAGIALITGRRMKKDEK